MFFGGTEIADAVLTRASPGPRFGASKIMKMSKFYNWIYTEWKIQDRATFMQKLEREQIRLIYFLNDWKWRIICLAVP